MRLLLLIFSILVLLTVIGGLAAGITGSHAAAPSTTVGVDVITSGNTATSLGAIDSCLSVSINDTFDVDLFVKDVSNLGHFEVPVFSYNGSVVNIVGNQVIGMFMGSGLLLLDNSDIFFPDSDGSFFIGALDLGGSHSGSGVLARVTLKAVGAGVSPLRSNLELTGNELVIAMYDAVDGLDCLSQGRSWVLPDLAVNRLRYGATKAVEVLVRHPGAYALDDLELAQLPGAFGADDAEIFP